MTNTGIEKKNYDSIDLLKIILSVLIVQIHSDFYLPWMKPYVRLAVPLFFIISAYFFFKKNPSTKNLLSYIKRLFILYAFWFTIFGSYFLYMNREEFIGEGDFLNGTIFFLKSLLFGSTFAASWYITASIIGTIIVFYLSRVLSNFALLVFSAIVYTITTLATSYYGLLSDNIGLIDDWYYEITNTHLSVSFPVSIFWIVIGKLLSNNNRLQQKSILYAILAIISLTLLQVEYSYVSVYCRLDDCFFLLVPSCICIFLLFQSLSINIPYSGVLRNISTIVYCSHYNIISITGMMLYVITGYTFNSFEKFFLGIIGAGIISVCIIYLERLKSFSWLKYSH